MKVEETGSFEKRLKKNEEKIKLLIEHVDRFERRLHDLLSDDIFNLNENLKSIKNEIKSIKRYNE